MERDKNRLRDRTHIQTRKRNKEVNTAFSPPPSKINREK